MTKDLFGGGITQACDADGIGTCPTGLPVRCDDSTDCDAGEICCGTLANDGYHDVMCRTSCPSSMGGGLKGVRFCDPDAPIDQCLTVALRCLPSSRLPGYSVCQ